MLQNFQTDKQIQVIFSGSSNSKNLPEIQNYRD